MPKIRAYQKPPKEVEGRMKKLLHPVDGRKVQALEVQVPQDHPQVKRYGLGHPYAKAFYLSTSFGSVQNSRAWPLHEMFVIDDGQKVSAINRALIGFWPLNKSAVEVASLPAKHSKP